MLAHNLRDGFVRMVLYRAVYCKARRMGWFYFVLYCLAYCYFLAAKLAKKCLIALIINVFNLYLSVVILSLLKFRKLAPHALKGQKLLAQGSALGYYGRKTVAL